MKVDVQRLEQRAGGDGTRTEAGHVLRETRHFNHGGEFTHRSLAINSPHMKAALRRVIGEYPGVSATTAEVRLRAPYRCLFHNLDELKGELEDLKVRRKVEEEMRVMNMEVERMRQMGDEGDGSGEFQDTDGGKLGADYQRAREVEDEAVEHLEFLIAFVEQEFEDEISDGKNYLPEGLITYETLWTIFRPGTIILQNSYNHQHALSLVRADYINTPEEHLALTLSYVDYNGKMFGLVTTKVVLQPFEGLERITSLAAYPLIFHPRQSTVRRTLITRGRRFESFVGRHFAEYKDTGLGATVDGRRVIYHLNGRVIVDADTYSRYNPTRFAAMQPLTTSLWHSPSTSSASRSRSPSRSRTPADNPPDYDYTSDYGSEYADEAPEKSEKHDKAGGTRAVIKQLTDTQCLIAHYLLPGFSMAEKTWVDVFIDTLAPIHWNHTALEVLVLPPQKKALMTTLVEAHIKNASNTAGFDDVIVGKGRALVMLLHGPPGVGKTLTIEAIAEQTRRPLYVLAAGELGTSPRELESKLARVMDLTVTWKAVLAIEDADLFLERRGPAEFQRSALVSAFLRLLDSYRGIVFLTSSRVRAVDDAVRSRAHVCLEYAELDFVGRRHIWETMLMREGNGSFGVLENSSLDALAGRGAVDGRMIRNVVVAARGLSERRGKADGAGPEDVGGMLEAMGVGRGGGKWRGESISEKDDGMQVVDEEVWTPLWFDKMVKPALDKHAGTEFARFERPY